MEKEAGLEQGSQGTGEVGRWADLGLGWLDVVLAIAAYLVLQVIGGIVLFGVLGYGLESIGGTLGLVAITAVAPILAVGLLVAARSRLTLMSIGMRGTSGRWLLVGAGVGLLGWAINRGVILLYVWVTGDTTNPQAGLMNAAQGTLPVFALLVLLAGLLTPFGEELFFRGMLFGWLRRWGLVVGVSVSAVVFGLFHGVNVVLPAAIVLGALNALLYEKSGSIWPAVIAHAVNNLAIFTLARALSSLGILDEISSAGLAGLLF